MQFTTTVALLASLAMSVAAVPSAGGPSGMAQNLHARTPTDKMIFGRSFYCASNDPTTCCACRGGYGTCINGECSCDGGDC